MTDNNFVAEDNNFVAEDSIRAEAEGSMSADNNCSLACNRIGNYHKRVVVDMEGTLVDMVVVDTLAVMAAMVAAVVAAVMLV
jgi:hypothetical protein